jgi:segregation and condensation protein A
MKEQSFIQQPLPLAFINGEAVMDKPEDLYIPPDALSVILEAFEGPLDLLLYLIRRQKLDLLTMPILQITTQYMEYVEAMKDLNLELAAEYLVMAAMLAEIKSRLLLPKRPSEEVEEDDPRAALIRRLKEYEITKKGAEELDKLPRIQREYFTGHAQVNDNYEEVKPLPEVSLQDLAMSFQRVLKRAAAFEHHQVSKEVLSTRERMSKILETLTCESYAAFETLFLVEEGKAGVVVTFLAVLELVKEKLVRLSQADPFTPIYVKLSQREEVVD